MEFEQTLGFRQKENQTIASQTAGLKEYAESHGYLLPAEWVFEDDGYSGNRSRAADESQIING